ncbi:MULTISPECIES: DNA-processing protein DprA [unclassified Thioalkalivibrio]|uniref:DNA-processing protein DprA n=1 Tax=unclassified Thioalkalivibrio TaxID=2621013 RepID=UPI0001959C29|nr:MULTISPECIES: DNA-processing protein DprA [unclassified Thioalkalivibrio]ADC72765.1 DNA protecting protein DprA [Thioalkalivibrio sp. K90mix]
MTDDWDRATHQRAWLELINTPGLGHQRLLHLVEAFGGPGAALAASPSEWRHHGVELNIDPAARTAAADADQAWLDQDERHHLLCRDDPDYPPLLAEIPDPPPVLYLNGDPSLLHRPQIAIIGARECTPQGERLAGEFARELAGAGVVVTSGLARGIDGVAHEGALAAPGGRTIAVVATGPDRIYPAQHRRLAHRIADHGLVVSLWPTGTRPLARNFPQRNRVISGMALGTVVVEAALKSGSLITARLAAEQGRQVYAVPGSVLSPVSRGCHRLIRDGAQLVESADEVLEDLADWLGVAPGETASTPPEPAREPLDPEQERVLNAMGFDPIPLETLRDRTKLTIERLSSMLVLLELNGRVAALDHGRYQRLDAGSPES